MGRAINRTLTIFGVIVLGTGFGPAQQGPPPEKFQQTDIFITSYRGPSVTDPSAYQNSRAGKEFEAELQSDDDERYCLQAPQLERATGLWKDSIEPSYWIHANARPTEAEAYTSEHAKAHSQDAAIVFEETADGPDAEYAFMLAQSPAIGVIFDTVKKAGFDGATIAGNKVLILDPKAALTTHAEALAQALGAKLETTRGRMRLLTEADFQKVLAIYDAFPHSCPGQN